MAFTTKKSLLAKVRAGDEVSWREFYDAYRPLIFLCGSDCSLTHDENEELVQKVMCEIFQKDIVGKYDPENIPENVSFKYDPERGRFRHYLKKIVHHQAVKIYRKRRAYSPLDEVPEMPAQESFDTIWNDEWRRHLLNMAMAELKCRVRPDTFVAFEMYAVQNRTVSEVCRFLNIPAASVYTAKSRCIGKLKEIIANLEDK